jgi:hypothetical protein
VAKKVTEASEKTRENKRQDKRPDKTPREQDISLYERQKNKKRQTKT